VRRIPSRSTRGRQGCGQTLQMSLLGTGGQRVKAFTVAHAAATAEVAAAAPVAMQAVMAKIMGYGILVGSLFLQMPQIVKISTSRSVTGISRASRYSEVPINSSACIYHILKKLPFSTWGENAAVLTQNLIIVGLVWIYEDQNRVSKREMLAVAAGFIALCFAQFSLPPALYPLMIYINIPLVFASTVPQVMRNFRQKHTGQVAILSNFLKLVGCSVRFFTTLTLIGVDLGLLVNYGFGGAMNAIIVGQGIAYREETKKVLDQERLDKMEASGRESEKLVAQSAASDS